MVSTKQYQLEQLKPAVKAALLLEKGDIKKTLSTPPANLIHTTIDPSTTQLGLELCRTGQVAAVTMAGGQGTRLGSSAPKGCFELQVDGETVSLFGLQAGRLLSVHNGACPWLIMTSPQTHAATEQFFTQHHYFGYPRDKIHFFQQGCLPAVTDQGDPIYNEHRQPIMAPDGNGGIFKAMLDNHLFDRLPATTTKYLHIFSVDNVLVRPCDPAIVGLCHSRRLQVCSKSVPKRSPSEKAGVFAVDRDSGKLVVSEYSELAAAVPDPALFMDANIANHVVSVEFARECAEKMLPLHVARKAIKVNEQGDTVPGIKLEQFIFDVFPWADVGRNEVWRVEREREFAPLKNAEGEDSPVECVKALERMKLAYGTIFNYL